MTDSPSAPLAMPRRETIPVFTRWLGSWQLSVARRPLGAGELARRYDRVAAGWDGLLHRLRLPRAYEALLRRSLTPELVTALADGGRALDCGTGTGAMSLALGRICPAPFALDAIDASQRMLAHARLRLDEAGLAATLQHGDVCALPYPDATFDLVMTAHVLEHLADPAIALAEMVRVLKPGGRLVVSVTRRSIPGMWIHLKWHTHRLTEIELERWLRAAGLQGVRCLSPRDARIYGRLSLACTGDRPRGGAHRIDHSNEKRRNPA